MENILYIPDNIKTTHMWKFMQFVANRKGLKFNEYQDFYQWSINYSDLFWEELINYFKIEFNPKSQQTVINPDDFLKIKWFKGAKFNYAEQLLNGKDPNHTAIISIDELNNKKVFTYHQLHKQVGFCQGGLKNLGVSENTRVGAILPNNSYNIIAFLATSALGGIWSSCSPDFGNEAILDRLGQIEPEIIFISDKHFYNGKKFSDLERIKIITSAIASIKKVIICSDSLKNPVDNAILWNDFIDKNGVVEFIPKPFDHPLYILFSSGTTGKPKCIVHSSGGAFLQHVKELGLHTDFNEKDNLFFYTTSGWMMWNWMISAFFFGSTLTIYDGSPVYPDEKRLFSIINKENVTVFGTSAKFLSVIEKSGIILQKFYKFKKLRCILSTGSPLLPKNFDFVYQQIKSNIKLCSISGGTDIVSCFALGNPILPIRRGELQGAGLAMKVEIFNDNGESVIEECGELVATKPFMSMPLGFWNDMDNKNYKENYFEKFNNVWAHGDFAKITKHNGLVIYGRSDTVLNPGGVRIGTAEIYRQVEKISKVLDSVAVGQKWHDDVRIVLFVQLKENIKLTEELKENIKSLIRKNASARHVPTKILQVDDIPRTINGKTVEIAVRQTVNNEIVKNIHSIANPQALEYFKDRLEPF